MNSTSEILLSHKATVFHLEPYSNYQRSYISYILILVKRRKSIFVSFNRSTEDFAEEDYSWNIFLCYFVGCFVFVEWG